MYEGCNRRCSAGRPQHGAKIETQPRLARQGKFDRLTDTPKDVAPGNTTGVALVNRRTQRGELRLVLLFFALQSPQPSAHNLTGIFVTPALDLCGYEVVKIVGQIDVAGRHSGGPFHGWELRSHRHTIGKDCQS